MEQTPSLQSFSRKYPETIGNLVLIIETTTVFELTQKMHPSRSQRVRENVTSVRARLLGLLYGAQVDPEIIDLGITLLKEPFIDALKVQMNTAQGVTQLLNHWSGSNPPQRAFIDSSSFID